MTAAGASATEQERQLAALTADTFEAAAWPPEERALMTYAEKLTRAPGEIAPPDAADLRAAGFDDRAIHDVCAIVAYFAFVNRIADGLGVELEPPA